ncbi:hypothetical protein GU926_09920 [Nibribacter ruber]|uniref:Uncharacterized protein n=1 Tax=Nibribacter ruber TaxID=2698458 RepID=A0A6P1NXI9_9BACT|nr:hypothetical protein [Nibribacter ruber]QHL87730.1 hypothetical protein GU926_09920 [Nibribacter ruber]
MNEIIESHRNSYVRQLAEFYSDRSEGIKEALLKLDNEESGLLFNLSRMDYLVKVDDEWKIEELSPDSYNNHSLLEFEYGDLIVELNPLFWHGVQFTVAQKEAGYSWLVDWATKWIDEDDSFASSSEDISGAIHSVTVPEQETDCLKFTVDFGTAPVDCFIELIDSLEENGISRVKIGSDDLISE